jgi:hypothetical protein
MMNKGMIVNPDHMSQRGVDDTLRIAEARHYSGVISPHGWMDPGNWPRIWKLGGMAFPGAGSAEGFVDAWHTYRPKRTPFYFGWGYGADLGGLAKQGSPPPDGAADAVKYPFKSIDGAATVKRQRTGDRTFDYSKEGVAHYGLYADWLKQVSNDGGRRITRDMLRGPEAYLEMWERSIGVPANGCLSSAERFSSRGLGKLRLGLAYHRLLERAGQPLRRTRAWAYCVKGRGNGHAAASAVLTPGGRVALVASTAHGHALGGVGPGAGASGVRASGAKPIGGGLWARGLRGSTAVYEVRHGAVRTVALASGEAAATDATLRAYMALAPRHATARPTRVIGGGAAPASAPVPLGVSHDSGQFPFAQRGARQFPYFCGL